MVSCAALQHPSLARREGFRGVIPDDSLRGEDRWRELTTERRGIEWGPRTSSQPPPARRSGGGPGTISAGHSVLMAIGACSAMARRGRGCSRASALTGHSSARAVAALLLQPFRTELLHRIGGGDGPS